MASIRRYARWALTLFTALFLLAVVVQILTAGFGIFGATSMDLHENLGFTVTHGLSILIFLAALVAWIEPRGPCACVPDRSADDGSSLPSQD